ncbi:MAG TPA: TIR domain-containing protein [Sphingomicrobium sp.]
MNKPEKLPGEESRDARPVFVSYATADRKEALAVCKAIERRGLKCWISTRDVEPGENYQESIVRALRGSRAMVLVFSDAANNSNEIKKELSLASRYHVPVMALRIEDVEPSDAFAYELSTRQWIDAFESWDKSIDALVRKIGQVGESLHDQSATDSRAAPKRRASTRSLQPLALGAIALAVVGAALIGWLLLRPAGGAEHTMQVRLAGFQRLSPDLPATMPAALADEINAAFNDDGVVTVSTAPAPAPGSSPAYAMSGTIRREGDKIKVIVHLTDERTGTTLWSNDYSYDPAVLARVPHLAAVESSMVVRCGLFGASTYPKPLPDNVLIPYLGFCQGSDGPGAAKALNFARKAVAIAPDFSWGWSGVAVSAAGVWLGSKQTDESARKIAMDAADRAVSIDPSNSEAYVYKAMLLDKYDLAAQEQLLKKALAARPLACGCEHHIYGQFLLETGRIEDAISQFRAGIAVLPLNAPTQYSLGDALMIDGSPDAAKQAYAAAADLDSDPTAPQQVTVQAAPFTGDYAAAAKIVFDPKVGAPQNFREAVGGAFQALASGSAPAKASAAQKLAAMPLMNPDLQVNLLALLGDPNTALQKIDENVRERAGFARSSLWLPSMDAARRDPAFVVLVQRFGLMRYWKTTHTRPDVCNGKNPPAFCSMI